MILERRRRLGHNKKGSTRYTTTRRIWMMMDGHFMRKATELSMITICFPSKHEGRRIERRRRSGHNIKKDSRATDITTNITHIKAVGRKNT